MERDKKSFTARDLNRSPAAVFDAVRKYGSVDIRTRKGETFVVRVKETPAVKKSIPDFDAHWTALRALGSEPAAESDLERVHEIVAGEE